ncbi:DUF3515 domain-containing protein [Nocardioides terrisoli]|uniref:DUF3515 domain-containing protein n=1 Tax=Nocardioides terrisoli TaxID=3388267 RepID=UPI00287BAC2D|nr:DUF3515 domain-containing protein [Nocardioides marmorisolisilvae]
MAGVSLLVVLGLLLAGCGGDVSVSRFAVTSAGHDRCPALIKALPGHVADQPRRRTTGSAFAAAWGDPAIVLRCGVGHPSGFTASATCLTTNGVDWFVPAAQIDDLGAGVVLTLVKRTPRIEVRIPAHYRPQGPSDAMVDLTGAVRAHTRVTGHCH